MTENYNEISGATGNEIDELDRQILEIVSKDASLSSADLGKRIGLSSTAANDRLRRLKKQGYITAIVAIVDPHKFDKNLLTFVRLKVGTKNKQKIVEELGEMPEVEEVHSIAGQFSLLVKVRTTNTLAMEEVFEEIYAIPDIIGSETDIVFRTYVDRTLIL